VENAENRRAADNNHCQSRPLRRLSRARPDGALRAPWPSSFASALPPI